MIQDHMHIITGPQITNFLNGREQAIIEAVRNAYITHRQGATHCPHSLFLRFPDKHRERIIALPAFLGGDFDIAGIKWISSFPDNLQLGIDRASAAIIINDMQTGRPIALLEGSAISAKRTAASAVLAGITLHTDPDETTVAFYGCGRINHEISRFLLASFPKIQTVHCFDLDAARAQRFADECLQMKPSLETHIVSSSDEVFERAPLVSIATTAVDPHLKELPAQSIAKTILHISLRDFLPEVVLQCDNIVDDVDHVMRASTSVHLAEQQVGHRDFVRCPLADVLMGNQPSRPADDKPVMFNPFGLGILDLALSHLVLSSPEMLAQAQQVNDFFETSSTT